MLVHYSPIEQNFIRRGLSPETVRRAPFVTQIIDTLEVGQRVFERRNHLIQPGDLRLFNLRPRYNLPQYKAHNALSDALATAELFLAMADNLYPGRKPDTAGRIPEQALTVPPSHARQEAES